MCEAAADEVERDRPVERRDHRDQLGAVVDRGDSPDFGNRRAGRVLSGRRRRGSRQYHQPSIHGGGRPGLPGLVETGVHAIREIAAGAAVHLRPGGWLLLEHGWEQGGAVRALLRDAGLDRVETARDLEGRDRVTLGCLAD